MHTLIASLFFGGVNCLSPDAGPELFKNGFEPRPTQVLEGESFASVFAPFGMSAGLTFLALKELEYMSLPIQIPNASEVSRLVWDEWGRSPDSLRISVSDCSGFPQPSDELALGSCFVQADGYQGVLVMSSQMTLPPQGVCIVEQGQTVWVNIAYVDSDGNFDCDDDECEAIFSVVGTQIR